MEKEEKEKSSINEKNSNNKFIVVVSFLILVIISLIIYICIDSHIIFKTLNDKDNNEKVEINKENTSENQQNSSSLNQNQSSQKEIDLLLDSSKVLNKSDNSIYTLNEDNWSNGLMISVAEDKKTIKLSINWNKIEEIYAIKDHSNNDEYTITFNDEIADIKLGKFGQDSMYTTLLFLMKDKTVEYIPIRKAIMTNNYRSYGKLLGVENIIKFVSVNVNTGNVGGRISTLAQKDDGNFIDLHDILKETGNY